MTFPKIFVIIKVQKIKKREIVPKMKKTIFDIFLIIFAVIAIILALAVYVNPLSAVVYIAIAVGMLGVVCIGIIFNAL